MFAPCHPATFAVGQVTDLNGMPIRGAEITLYGIKTISNTNGCFAFDMADALPFELSAVSEGFKTITVPSQSGSFIISIKLAPVGSSENSEINWEDGNKHDYQNTEPNPCT